MKITYLYIKESPLGLKYLEKKDKKMLLKKWVKKY